VLCNFYDSGDQNGYIIIVDAEIDEDTFFNEVLSIEDKVELGLLRYREMSSFLPKTPDEILLLKEIKDKGYAVQRMFITLKNSS
jgi:hypothetical protein